MASRKKQDLQSEIEKLEKKQTFHKQQAQKSAIRLKELLNQSRNNHLMAFGVGIEFKYLAGGEELRQKLKNEYCEIYANDQRMLQRALDGFSRLDKQLSEKKSNTVAPETEDEQEDEGLMLLIGLGLPPDKAEEITRSAMESGADLKALLENAGKAFDGKPEAARKSTRERYLLGTLKKTFNVEF